LEFKEKQFDGPYEVVEVEINNKGEIFKGLLYLPPESFKKPYPLVIYFHGFPQIFPLQEIVKSYKLILDIGMAFLIFNFRGYRYSDGEVSIRGQYSDALKIIEFAEKLAHNGIFDLKNVNILAHDFGACIALILCSKIKLINNLLLLSPILNLERHVYNEDFGKVLNYINKFLPNNVKGIKKVDEFIKLSKNELKIKKFQIGNFISNLKVNDFKVIIGEVDKITPLEEIYQFLKEKSNILPKIVIIKNMDHYYSDVKELKEINKEIKEFFKKKH